jgi:aminocarboxymuconate-semialdehyde decarboxylase
VHAHVVPAALLDRMAGGERPGFGVEPGPGGGKRFKLGGEARGTAVPPAMYDLDLRLQAMDEAGVAVQLLGPTTSLAGYTLSEDDGVWLASALNAEIEALVRAVPDRFVGLGSVPLQAPARAADLLRRGRLEQGLLGVLIAATAGPDRDLDEPALEPFWAAAEALEAFVVIHPHEGVRSKRFESYYLNNLIQNPLDTTIAAAHLIFGGVLERHPGLMVCLAHGGGFLPYDLGRLVRGKLVRGDESPALQGSVEDSFRRLYFDSVTHSSAVLGFLARQATPEHVLLGSDFPYDMGDPTPPKTVEGAGLSPAETHLILRGNADRLLKLVDQPANR